MNDEALLKTTPDKLAAKYLEAGDFAKAQNLYLQAVALNPDSPEIHYNLAVTHLKLGQPEKMIESLLNSLAVGLSSFALIAIVDSLERCNQFGLIRRLYRIYNTASFFPPDILEEVRSALMSPPLKETEPEAAQLPPHFTSIDLSELSATRKLKIYSDQSFLPEGNSHNALLWPFWGHGSKHGVNLTEHAFLPWTRRGGEYFELTAPSTADFAVYPGVYSQEYHDHAVRFVESVKQYGLQTIIFECSDNSDPIGIPNTIVFRNSLYRGLNVQNERAASYFIDDPMAFYLNGKLALKDKGPRPKVTFCGQPIHEYLHLRNTAIVVLELSPLVETSFIIREGYLGGYNPATTKEAEVKKHRLEFVRNMMEGDYNLVVRGAGNYSIRLYETLAAGRIPVFVDSECVLPFDDQLEWRKHVLWVDYPDIGLIAHRVLEFHNSISNEEFIHRQQECRRFWERYLTPLGFFSNLHKWLISHARG